MASVQAARGLQIMMEFIRGERCQIIRTPKFVVTIVGQDGATHNSKLFSGDKTILDVRTWVKEVQFLLPAAH